MASHVGTGAKRSLASPAPGSVQPSVRPGASRHLRVLCEAGLVQVRQDAQRRAYSLSPGPLAEVDQWLARYRSLWEQRLNALHTEIARGNRQHRT
jgi:hypothetical protein